MNHINVEANESFEYGFILTESELRRIVDTINDQFKKLDQNVEINTIYEIKYANGVVASTTILDDIIKEENSGSAKIVRLQISSDSNALDHQHKTVITFEDTEGDSAQYPIKYKIIGSSRDWVFVTSSMLEERIKKIKRSDTVFNLISGEGRGYRSLRLLFTMLLLIISMFFGLFSSFKGSAKTSAELNNIEKLWRIGKIKDPIAVSIMIERIRLKEVDNIKPFSMFKPMILLFILLVAGFLSVQLMNRYYPRYNFCWGDNLLLFEKTETRRKNIFWIVIVGFIISVVSGLVSTYLFNISWL